MKILLGRLMLAYDLGGGATAFASMDSTDYTAVGLNFAF